MRGVTFQVHIHPPMVISNHKTATFRFPTILHFYFPGQVFLFLSSLLVTEREVMFANYKVTKLIKCSAAGV